MRTLVEAGPGMTLLRGLGLVVFRALQVRRTSNPLPEQEGERECCVERPSVCRPLLQLTSPHEVSIESLAAEVQETEKVHCLGISRVCQLTQQRDGLADVLRIAGEQAGQQAPRIRQAPLCDPAEECHALRGVGLHSRASRQQLQCLLELGVSRLASQLRLAVLSRHVTQLLPEVAKALP